ncbi:MAG: aromatic ring-hydroxylating dioxygenase subunit alpha [Rhizobiales bacterium]|nr:aromatic ring-hydroxylating dioxygenase subunit alpha [Hyphomicrobiales bacterium]
MTIHIPPGAATPANDWDRRGLPGWTYHNPALLELEMDQILLRHWQIVGHVNDVPKPGDYMSFDLGPERAFVLRQQDGTLRAFHNLCRHRGSRIVTEGSGHCKNALVCPFHGWVYNFDGTLRGAARPTSFAELDKHKFGLKPVELDVWMGFIFIRFKPGPQESVAATLAPYATEIGSHLPELMVPTGQLWNSELPVNWKSVRDVDNEGYHVAMAHPALQDLYGFTYRDTDYGPQLRVSKGTFKEGAGRMWSVRHYVRNSTPHPALPEDRRSLWGYYGVFPNAVFITTPETIQFYQELPIDVNRSIVRGMVYRYPEESRKQRLARYLSYRIDRATYAEDTQLAIWSNESMKSSAFDSFHLSDHERFLRAHHDDLRRLLPVLKLDHPPAPERMAEVNSALHGARD